MLPVQIANVRAPVGIQGLGAARSHCLPCALARAAYMTAK